MRGNLSTPRTWIGVPAARKRIIAAVSSAGSTGPAVVHATLGSTPKIPSMRDAARRDEPVREQVQPQVGVLRVGRRLGEVLDHDRAQLRAHAAALVAALGAGQRVLVVVRRDVAAEPRVGEEDVQHAVAGVGQRRQPHAPRARRLG